MAWTKMHTDAWLYGRIREFAPAIRSVWPDLQAQADASPIRGIVCAAPGVGFSDEQLAAMWKTPVEVVREALAVYEAEKIDPQNLLSPGWITRMADGTIVLNEWPRFQDEYQRLKKYRVTDDTGKGTEKGTEKNTTESTEKGTVKSTEKSHSKNTPQIQIQIQNQNTDLKDQTQASWRTDLKIYEKEASDAFDTLLKDRVWLADRQKYHPHLDILLTLEKAFNDYWGTELGWKFKKKDKKLEKINWKNTFNNCFSIKSNQVPKNKGRDGAHGR